MALPCATGTGKPRWTASRALRKSACAADTSDAATTAVALTPTVRYPRQQSRSLGISIDDSNLAANTINLAVCESSDYELSPCTSPSFSFDSVRDMFAAMNSPVVSSVLPTDESVSSMMRQVHSPSIKRQRKNTGGSSFGTGTNTTHATCSDAAAVQPVRATSRYSSMLSRCLPRQLKRSSVAPPSPCHLDVLSESPCSNLSFRTTETTTDSIASATSCSQTQLLLVSSPSPTGAPARRRFGTVLLTDDNQDLHLFRDEAEYSDYLSAVVTGAHSEIDAVVYYELEVHLSQSHWRLYRRFSEFRALRQSLLKHFITRLQHQQNTAGSASSSTSPTRCEICSHMLAAIEQTPFPSRQQTHRRWHRLFTGPRKAPSTTAAVISGDASSTPVSSNATAAAAAAMILDRKAKFSDFVGLCLRTVSGLRQHEKVMEDSSACEIDTALRLLEEFLGLSFTRYLRFLSERGVVGSAKVAVGATSGSSTTSRRRLTTAT